MARGLPTSTGGRLSVQSRGRIELDLLGLAKVVGPAAVGHVLDRCDQGLDIHDQPFAPYSKEYAQWLTEGGEDPTHVDLRLTGGLLSSVKVQQQSVDGAVLALDIGPGTGTSEERHVHGVSAFERFKGAKGVKPKGKPRLTKTGKRGPPHNLVGQYLQKKRPWLGISPKGMKVIASIIERTKVFKGGV